MAQVITLPRTITFTREFEELPLYSERTRSGETFFAGLVDGSLEVSFDSTGDWHISDIHIRVQNYQMGDAALAKISASAGPALAAAATGVVTDVSTWTTALTKGALITAKVTGVPAAATNLVLILDVE